MKKTIKLGKFLKLVRRLLNLSVIDLSSEMKISVAHLSKFENGIGKIKMVLFVRLCRELKVTNFYKTMQFSELSMHSFVDPNMEIPFGLIKDDLDKAFHKFIWSK